MVANAFSSLDFGPGEAAHMLRTSVHDSEIRRWLIGLGLFDDTA